MNRRRVVSHTANLNLTKKKLLRAKTLPVGHTELGISRCRARARTPTNQHSCVQQILWRAGWALRGPPACLPRSPPRRPVAAHALFLIDPAAARIVVDVPRPPHAPRLCHLLVVLRLEHLPPLFGAIELRVAAGAFDVATGDRRERLTHLHLPRRRNLRQLPHGRRRAKRRDAERRRVACHGRPEELMRCEGVAGRWRPRGRWAHGRGERGHPLDGRAEEAALR